MTPEAEGHVLEVWPVTNGLLDWPPQHSFTDVMMRALHTPEP